jgi:rubrerythrin
MAKSLSGTKSHENLKHAFAGESQANRRYLYFARVADIGMSAACFAILRRLKPDMLSVISIS